MLEPLQIFDRGSAQTRDNGVFAFDFKGKIKCKKTNYKNQALKMRLDG